MPASVSPKTAARAIREAPELYGQEEVLARGRVLAAGDPALAAPLERLAQVYHLLCAAGHRESLLLDLGEFRGFDYYDGVVFDVFAEGMGAELGGGGRYDHLIGRFGRPLPSTGFGLDVDRLFRTVEFPEEGSASARVDYLVAAPRRATRLIDGGCGPVASDSLPSGAADDEGERRGARVCRSDGGVGSAGSIRGRGWCARDRS